jgi:hypothetical protein
MKNILLIFTLSIYCAKSNAQDYIITLDGDEIKSKVIEVNYNDIKYRKFENINGPIYSILKSEVLLIRYENGSKEIYSNSKKNIDPKSSNFEIGISLGIGNTIYNNLNNSEYYQSSGNFTSGNLINFKSEKYKTSSISINAKYRLKDKFYLSSQLNLNICKTDFNLENFYTLLPDEYNRKSRIFSITMPINILYNFYNLKFKSKKIKIGGLAGPCLSYLTFDNVVKPDGNKLNSISALDLGFNIGLNLEMPKSYFINVMYSIEAVNMKNYKTLGELRYYYREDRIINQHLLGNRNSFIIQIGKYF